MVGELGAKLGEIVAGYNESQSEYRVLPSYKGTYPGTMTAAEGAVYPVYQPMEDAGEPFDPADYLPAVVGYYTDSDGNMLSMPFNSSTPDPLIQQGRLRGGWA